MFGAAEHQPLHRQGKAGHGNCSFVIERTELDTRGDFEEAAVSGVEKEPVVFAHSGSGAQHFSEIDPDPFFDLSARPGAGASLFELIEIKPQWVRLLPDPVKLGGENTLLIVLGEHDFRFLKAALLLSDLVDRFGEQLFELFRFSCRDVVRERRDQLYLRHSQPLALSYQLLKTTS